MLVKIDDELFAIDGFKGVVEAAHFGIVGGAVDAVLFIVSALVSTDLGFVEPTVPLGLEAEHFGGGVDANIGLSRFRAGIGGAVGIVILVGEVGEGMAEFVEADIDATGVVAGKGR